MENTMLPLVGVARAKYVRDFTRKVNDSDNFAEILASKKARKSSGMKKKRKIEPRISIRLQKKDIDQEYIVQRMKFLKQSIEMVNEAVNKTQPTIKDKPVVRFSQQSKFQQFKNKSFEIERQKLAEMYRVHVQNLNMSMEPVNEPKILQAESPAPKPHPDEPEPIKDPSIARSLIHNPIILQDLQQGDDCISAHPKVDLQQAPERVQSDREVIPVQPSDLIRSSTLQDEPQDRAIQLCQNQLQNINLNSNRCSALVPSSMTSRRICHRTKRFKRYSMKPFCAHCHDHISVVAFFSGTQQLCFDCADKHYERVSRARYQGRPMGYKEFKNIGGDTIYNKN